MTSIALSRPIKAHNEQLTELLLREPNAGDLFKAGVPYKVEVSRDGASRTVYDAGAIRAMISLLAGIPTSSVDTMSPADFMGAANVIINFTTEASRATSSIEPSS